MDRDVQTRTAYHESGHAVAAVIRGEYVTYIDLEVEFETCTDVKRANIAFGVWAGRWAQAYWEENCTVDRIVEIFQTQSFHDWPRYEGARDDRRAAVRSLRCRKCDAVTDAEGFPV